MSRPIPSRRLAFGDILIHAVFALLEGGSRLAMYLLASDRRFAFTPVRSRNAEMQVRVRELLALQGDALVELDGELGWVYRQDYRGELD